MGPSKNYYLHNNNFVIDICMLTCQNCWTLWISEREIILSWSQKTYFNYSEFILQKYFFFSSFQTLCPSESKPMPNCTTALCTDYFSGILYYHFNLDSLFCSPKNLLPIHSFIFIAYHDNVRTACQIHNKGQFSHQLTSVVALPMCATAPHSSLIFNYSVIVIIMIITY